MRLISNHTYGVYNEGVNFDGNVGTGCIVLYSTPVSNTPYKIFLKI